ncbi:60S ribosome subunit biogenesis protein NIP7 homolog isoform X1 [Sorex araneus]|uniref:60S ribosome subunit biogenesis protein NIP7 homolog isoform X1 n=1 Tax=Sorex araneus TaxID=42254 RepID=UPI0024335387|nr:60S ribosome subunit biogenesis protein NIP7 homolog isoform X1 [Sorex araneus]
MRPLTEEETRVMFEKVAKYIGENLQLLVDRPDGTYCFRLHNERVYYVSEKILKLAANIAGDKLVSLGTCFGKFTKTRKFRLHVTALDYLAPYAKYKVWIKPGAEQSFLYGNHVLKSGLGRITENTSQYQGVVVYSMADIPLTTSGGAQDLPLSTVLWDHWLYSENQLNPDWLHARQAPLFLYYLLGHRRHF